MRVAIIGTGPTGLYCFKNLISSHSAKEISLYDKGPRLGVGMPYSPETANQSMLANIASVEIPPVTEDYLTWMKRKNDVYLKSYNLNSDEINDRTFTPRLMLGDFFHDQMTTLIRHAREHGLVIHEKPASEVIDVTAIGENLLVITENDPKGVKFDKVILATGHSFGEDDDLTDHYFPNPWSGLIGVSIPATAVGILGTSLSAIDAAMAVACQHGDFVADGDDLSFVTDAKGKLVITMMSWSGILPEADFYCPIPYTPLEKMTPDALEKATTGQKKFEAAFELFKQEVQHADEDWANRIGLLNLSPEEFKREYFRDREVNDSFRWARENLREALKNHNEKKTIPWRYAILRMHEAFETIVSTFDDDERERFDKTLKNVFVDNYAAVPPESIKRLLALRDAGVLKLLALNDDYRMENKEDHVAIYANGREYQFSIFVDARGQRPMRTEDMPFPSLRNALQSAGHDDPQISCDFGLMNVPGYEGVYVASLPYLMEERPFVQGITASAEIGQLVARATSTSKARRRLIRYETADRRPYSQAVSAA